jgi:hypothetical protein
MLVNIVTARAPRSQLACVAVALAVLGSACGTTVAQGSSSGTGDLTVASTSSAGQVATSAGSFSVDYDTALHLGLLREGAGATSLDYDTARHTGRLGAGVAGR